MPGAIGEGGATSIDAPIAVAASPGGVPMGCVVLGGPVIAVPVTGEEGPNTTGLPACVMEPPPWSPLALTGG